MPLQCITTSMHRLQDWQKFSHDRDFLSSFSHHVPLFSTYNKFEIVTAEVSPEEHEKFNQFSSDHDGLDHGVINVTADHLGKVIRVGGNNTAFCLYKINTYNHVH
jgi:hypothetical protein